ncbi:hypothetical protein TcasGA2_TC032805 [Tribolium castaneum]|uniref:Uncharacterized protein n=1 Tax=Tribolium castaneum TaxID=7070 RepID=A0A139WJ31_TRICA|nr:hypothetical protein TcasGA2_TC032805 [Tribolium castaneum]
MYFLRCESGFRSARSLQAFRLCLSWVVLVSEWSTRAVFWCRM